MNGQKTPTVVWEYGLAIGATSIALLARLMLDPILGEQFAFMTFFVAIAVTAHSGGLWPSLAAVSLSALAADWFFLPPRYSLRLTSTADVVGLISYGLLSLVLVGFGQGLQRARRRAERTLDVLQESEERLRLAAEGAHLGLWFWDIAKNELIWTGRCKELFGLTGDGAVSFERFVECLHPEDRPRTVEAVMRAQQAPVPYDIEYRAVWPDGSTHWIGAKGRSVFNEQGTAVRVHGIVMDIDARKRVEEALRESDNRLRSFAGQLEQLVNERTEELVQSEERLRGLATELNLTEQRERKRLATELHDHLAQMLVLGKLKVSQARKTAGAEGSSLLKEADDVLTESLTYTRTLVADLAPPVLHDFGLLPALKWLCEQMEPRGLTVAFRCPDGELKLSEAHAVLLFQSVRELLMNASKHARVPRALVSIHRSSGALSMEVRDEGVGFDLAAVAAPAADRNGRPVMSSKFGLFSIRERMRALGGRFDLQSAPGHGTIATLTVPLESPATTVLHPHSSHSSPSHDEPALGTRQNTSPIQVLLVDDHAMVRQGLRTVLDAYADIEVVGEAADGVEAVALVEALKPGLVLMDINMPRKNGIEATADIKARFPAVIVIGLSVQANDEAQSAMLKAGAAALLTKEAAVEQLYEAIQSALQDSANAGQRIETGENGV